MDSLVLLNDASPLGEALSRPDNLEHATYDNETTALILKRVLALPQNGVGLLVCVGGLVRDLRKPIGVGSVACEWESALQALKVELETSKTESQDLILAGKNTSYQLRMLFAKFDPTISQESKQRIRQLRTRVILHHLGRRQPIPERLARWFVQIIAGPDKQGEEFAAKLSCNREDLRNLRSSYSPESDQAEFLTSLITAIDAPIISPPIVSPQQIAPVVSTSPSRHDENDELGNGADSEDRSNPQDQEAANASVDIVGQFLKQTEYARPRDFSGISNTWDYLQPTELESAVSKFVRDLDGPYAQESIAALITISSRTHPKAYGFIPITESAEHSMWVDLESGHICWRLEAVIDRKLRRKIHGKSKGRLPVRIPLPVEVSSRLQALHAANPLAKNLGGLFGGHLSSLEAATQKYLKKVSINSHRLTLGRLASSLARYIVYNSQDEAYASLLGIDFRIGTPSNFNYCSFRASRVNSILREVYTRLGLSGEISVPITTDVGSRYLGAMVNVDATLRDSLEDVFAAYRSVRHKHDAVSIAAAHTRISGGVLRATCIVTGHRESDNHSFANHTIDLAAGLALISDKLVSPYHHVRMVPIPTVIAEWLKFYFRWLEHVRYRYLSLDKRVSKYIDSLLKNPDLRADGALFFSLSPEGNIRALKNENISERFKRKALEANAGRHWVENILREACHDSAVIMAWSGHSAIGQEAFGIRSALNPMVVMNAVRLSLDMHLDSLSLPQPPSLKPRKADTGFEHVHDFIPGGFGLKPEIIVGNLLGYEVCPFDEMSLVRSRQFVEICRKWFSAGIDKSVGSIAICLIVNDGIVNREELIGAVKEILWGKIYKNNNQYFVDSNTQGLGIRRTWLSSVSAVSSAQVDKSKCGDSELILSIYDAVSLLLEACKFEKLGCPLDQILEMAKGFYSLRLPGILRGWVLGNVHARTSRPETVARHRFKLVEHPKIEEEIRRNRSRQDSSDKFITELILRESDTTEYRGREKTRLHALHNSLMEYEGAVRDSGVIEIKLRYAIYLAETVDSPATVKRYYYPLRQFIENSCSSIDGLDDFNEIEWEKPVNKFRNHCVAKSEYGQDPDLVALNHFLRCFSINLFTIRKCDPAESARRYTDYPSTDEVRRALDELPAISSLPPSKTALAVLAFKTMAARYLRWFEVSRLRIIDAVGLDEAALAITHEAVGTHKSDNADRVHSGVEHELSAELMFASNLRSQQFNNDSETFLFCNSKNNHSVSQSNELRRLISDALWSVTGSEYISPHCARRLVPIEMCEEYLLPELRSLKSPLALRQFLFVLAGNIGHGDPLTTVANYLCRFDEWRRHWVDHLKNEAKIEASTIFTASILGIAADTLRARTRRNSKLAQNEILDDFDFDSHPSFVTRTRNLIDYLVAGTTRLQIVPRVSSSDESVSCAVYVAARLLGQEADLAAFISQISDSSKKRIDRGLTVLSGGLGRAWNVNVQVSPTDLLNNDLFIEASSQFSDCRLNVATALTVSRVIIQPDSAWNLSSIEDAGVINKLLARIANRLVTCIVSRPKNKVGDYRVFVIFPQEEYLHRQLNSRLFPRDCILRIQFVPNGTTTAGIPATAPTTTFLISAILISRCALTLGENDEYARFETGHK